MVKNILVSFLSLTMLLMGVGCSSPTRQRVSFNDNWLFMLGEAAEAAEPTYDDSNWRSLNVPHDWSIELPFAEDAPAGPGGGALPGGIGWYRKHFTVGDEIKDKKVYIDFDGVYMNSEVFINGHSLGVRPFGYISFRYDLTPYLKPGEDNVIAVRVDNSKQPNSRWYSGSGIYRNTWLTTTNPVHVDLWGTYVTTPVVTDHEAQVKVETTVRNASDKTETIRIITTILNDKGSRVALNKSQDAIVQPGDTALISQSINVINPIRWTLENPYLYTVQTKVVKDAVTLDVYDTPLGIREFKFDAEKGFFLNGVQTKIKGVCQHHDLGSLGAAVNTRALERQLEILQEMGCNGIRMTHNPPAPELLELCDRMGFIVQDETFDIWRKRKTEYDYSHYFNDWHERDMTDHILRDRNHPSIFMWSIGNEVLEQWSHADADTLSLAEANLILNFGQDESLLAKDGEELGVNSLLTIKLANLVKSLDNTRYITAGCNEANPRNFLFASGALDIIGFNYQDKDFAKVPQNFPGKPFIITESTSGLMTRGYYRMPSDSMYIWPERWDKPFYDSSFACSSYDNCHVPWGTTHEDSWRWARDNDFISGLYVWTGFDYMGEPTPYGWPARSSYFGIIDLAGFPKDVYYMYQSEWSDEPVLHLFPHWNWAPGQDIDLWAYYNNADEVELFINGESKGVKSKGKDDMHVMWRVQFEPGTARIVSRKDGKEVLTKEIKTAGEPAAIRLTADRNIINADGKDLSFVTVEIVDKDGNICPNADDLVTFDVKGPAFIAGVDNGNPTSHESFKAPERKAFYGKCLVILQNDGKGGVIELTASGKGLQGETIKIKANN